MKNYTITVNGNVYDVTVEENGSVATPVSAPRRAAAPIAAPVAAAPKASAGAGSVKIDGKDVREIPLQTLRKNIGIVMQKPVLFHGTIRENLLWGNENATEEEIMEALELSQSLEFVMQKEKTLDYIIEQGGKNLSGGQRQRLTIARALIGKPGILIFDDSTSALDYATDYRLRKALSHLAYHPTIFMISQRTSSICHANQILVLDDGKMMGKGTHETLRKDCEVYEEIHSVQNA